MLQYRGQGHDRLSETAPECKLGCTDAVVSAARKHHVNWIDALLRLPQRDVETGVSIETALDGSVIASELELMLPIQLECYRLERRRIGKHWRAEQCEQRQQQAAHRRMTSEHAWT